MPKLKLKINVAVSRLNDRQDEHKPKNNTDPTETEANYIHTNHQETIDANTGFETLTSTQPTITAKSKNPAWLTTINRTTVPRNMAAPFAPPRPLSEDEMTELGLLMRNKELATGSWAKRSKSSRVQIFKDIYQVHPLALSHIWNDLQTTPFVDDRIDERVQTNTCFLSTAGCTSMKANRISILFLAFQSRLSELSVRTLRSLLLSCERSK